MTSPVGAPQQILSGKYRLERELGRGGMGSVWLAQHLTLRSPVAIKLIDPSIAQNPEALQRFLREAQSAASLRSPHVVQILDHGVDEGVPFIVMELLEGESLASRIEKQRRLPPVETARILTQVARAIGRAHEAGIVHRDLKPDNIFLVLNDEEEIAKVLDFGVAKATSHGMGSVSGATRTGSVLGTPYYMSPEQAEGAKTVDGRSDLWSLGVIAWECILGTRPFDSETLGGLLLAICAREIPVPSRMGPVPPGFDAWFARACARDMNHRYSTAKELANELRVVCGGAMPTGPMPVGAYPGGPMSSSQGGMPVQAASLPLASTTAHLGMSASSDIVKKKSAAPVVALVAGVLVLGAAGAFFALRGDSDATVASATPSAAPVPPEPKAAAAAAPPEAPAPVIAATPAASSATPSVAAPAAAAGVRRPAARPAIRTTKPEKPAAAPAAPAPAPAAPAPAPAKPRVNLGI